MSTSRALLDRQFRRCRGCIGCNPAAVGDSEARSPTAANLQHLPEQVLGEIKTVGSDAIVCDQEPPRRALRDLMGSDAAEILGRHKSSLGVALHQRPKRSNRMHELTECLVLLWGDEALSATPTGRRDNP